MIFKKNRIEYFSQAFLSEASRDFAEKKRYHGELLEDFVMAQMFKFRVGNYLKKNNHKLRKVCHDKILRIADPKNENSSLESKVQYVIV
jgi:hypothetical protein